LYYNPHFGDSILLEIKFVWYPVVIKDIAAILFLDWGLENEPRVSVVVQRFDVFFWKM